MSHKMEFILCFKDKTWREDKAFIPDRVVHESAHNENEIADWAKAHVYDKIKDLVYVGVLSTSTS